VTTAEPILPTHVPALVEGTARVGPIPIPQVLREFGIDPIEVITSVGVDPALFDDPDNRLAFRAVGQLMGACVARTGCPHFGLLVGQRSGLNSLLQRLLHEEVKRITGRRAVAFADQVRRVVRAAMVSHGCSAEAVARTFSIQRRTLSRRLSAEGTTFEAVLGEVRYEVARQLLGQTNTPVEKIADTLGYSDAPPFIRAFRRWSGMTPGLWRSRSASGSG
jgi:AraC-like DNA-binding protein